MKNYKNTSYAANKYSKDIVYKSEVSGSKSITLEDFLKSDPNLTEADFEFWKNWSDEDYKEEAKSDNRISWKSVNLTNIEMLIDTADETLEELIENQIIQNLIKVSMENALTQLYADSSFTSTMRRRFEMYYFDGLSTVEIAKIQMVNSKSVSDSVNSGLRKLKSYMSIELKTRGIDI